MELGSPCPNRVGRHAARPARARRARHVLSHRRRMATRHRVAVRPPRALVAHHLLSLEEDARPRRFPPDTLERLSHVFGIYKSLQVLVPGPAAATWIHRPNAAPLFDGRAALEIMLGGVAGLFLVRAYLDAERGWRLWLIAHAHARARAGRRSFHSRPSPNAPIPVRRVLWRNAVRIIPSVFPAIDLFERVTAPEDLDAIQAIESAFNPRLRDAVGDLTLRAARGAGRRPWRGLHHGGVHARVARWQPLQQRDLWRLLRGHSARRRRSPRHGITVSGSCGQPTKRGASSTCACSA